MSDKHKPDAGLPLADKPKKLSLFAWLRGRFFAGMVIAAPIAITFYALRWVINTIDNTVKPLLPTFIKPETYTKFAIPGFGVIVMVIALTILGAIAANLIGRSIVRGSDRLLSRLPVVRNIYSAIKQLVDVIANNQTASFDEVVLVEYPKRGSWCLGFVASAAKGEIKAALGPEFLGVFVPTTPNPTSGFLIYVMPEEVIRLRMTVEEGAKMILSAGLVVPEHLPLAEGETLSPKRIREPAAE